MERLRWIVSKCQNWFCSTCCTTPFCLEFDHEIPAAPPPSLEPDISFTRMQSSFATIEVLLLASFEAFPTLLPLTEIKTTNSSQLTSAADMFCRWIFDSTPHYYWTELP